MTLNANRYNIKRFKIVWMMIFFCVFSAIVALQSIRFGQFTDSNSIHNSFCSFTLSKMSNTKAFIISFAFLTLAIAFLIGSTFLALPITLMRGFAFFGLAMAFLHNFALITFLILRVAYFAFSSKTIFFTTIFIKFRKRFGFLALGTSFRYDWFSHNVLSLQKNVLVRADRATIALFGSSYCTADWGDFK